MRSVDDGCQPILRTVTLKGAPPTRGRVKCPFRSDGDEQVHVERIGGRGVNEVGGRWLPADLAHRHLEGCAAYQGESKVPLQIGWGRAGPCRAYRRPRRE